MKKKRIKTAHKNEMKLYRLIKRELKAISPFGRIAVSYDGVHYVATRVFHDDVRPYGWIMQESPEGLYFVSLRDVAACLTCALIGDDFMVYRMPIAILRNALTLSQKFQNHTEDYDNVMKNEEEQYETSCR